jgi:hypothetical protein
MESEVLQKEDSRVKRSGTIMSLTEDLRWVGHVTNGYWLSSRGAVTPGGNATRERQADNTSI